MLLLLILTNIKPTPQAASNLTYYIYLSPSSTLFHLLTFDYLRQITIYKSHNFHKQRKMMAFTMSRMTQTLYQVAGFQNPPSDRSMMNKLPNEVLHEILYYAALSRGVTRALRLKLVCREFIPPSFHRTL